MRVLTATLRTAEPSLDQNSPLPLYAQLRQHLEEELAARLRAGECRPGDFFTTEKQVCQRFAVSAITAKRALDDMEAEGRLVRQRGRGTFVAQPRIQQVLDHFYRFTTYMQEHGLRPESRLLELRTAVPDAHVAASLRIAPGETALEIDRLRLVNGEPFFLQTSYLPLTRLPGIAGLDHQARGLYEILAEEYQLAPTRCTDTFEPVLLRKHEIERLETRARIPGLRLERITWSGETPVEFSRGVIRGDRCRLTVDLR